MTGRDWEKQGQIVGEICGQKGQLNQYAIMLLHKFQILQIRRMAHCPKCRNYLKKIKTINSFEHFCFVKHSLLHVRSIGLEKRSYEE